MAKMCKISFTITLFLFFFVSCEKKDELPTESRNAPLQFTSEITGNESRMVNTLWEAGDRIGIFMKSTGEALSVSSIVDGVSNREYVTPAGHIFSPASESQAIRFPQNGSGVDFIAYYPYTDNLNGLKYSVDVSNQNDPAKIDLLYSENVVNANPNNPQTTLSFSRRLTKIIFNIDASDNVSSLNGLKVTLSGTPTSAQFDLTNGTLTADNSSVADILLRTTITSNTAQAEAILIPDEGGSGRLVTISLDGVGTFEWEIPETVQLKRGQKYTENITLNAEGIEVVKYGWTETPLMSSTLPDNLVYITHEMPEESSVRNYSMLFDKVNRVAYWVAYPLHSYYLGETSRTNYWRHDPKIPTDYQPNLGSAFGIDGIDRGHHLPSADRTNTILANRTTFYFSNITAQNRTLNQNEWKYLEEKIRDVWTARCDTLYVVTGAAITTPTDNTIEYVLDNSHKSVAKPKYYFKALAQLVDGVYYTLAFKMNNEAPTGGYNQYRLTVKELEDATGYTFFPSIPTNNKNVIVSARWN